jgi:deazaflavin-dependent oxidoreductase (nitroreductase family)
VDAKALRFRILTGVHKALFRASRGRVGGRGGGMPMLMLTTVGRRSGRRRTTMLSTPVRDGERIVLVASYGGDDRHPAWFLNLRDHPEVDVTMAGRTRRLRARVLSADEKADVWPRIVRTYPGYGRYQERTARDIPVVVLEP